MVVCCVPNCNTDSWRCDPSITFHDFPSNPDLAARWIKQINTAVKVKPMWFPRGRPVVCSKHFLHTDFKGDTDALKPRCIPTVFGYKYIGQNPEAHENEKLSEPKKSPLIVKVNKPQTCVLENNSDLRISGVYSQADANCANGDRQNQDLLECSDNSQELEHQNAISSNSHHIDNSTSWISSRQNESHSLTQISNKVGCNGLTLKNGPKKTSGARPSSLPKKGIQKKEKTNSDLIEIGPNTFLKINPDIIKVNKKLTPSGNTVLQFLMDQKLAKSQSADLLPKLIQGIPASSKEKNNYSSSNEDRLVSSSKLGDDKESLVNSQSQGDVVQHVLGHLVDTHVCEDSCADLKLAEEENTLMEVSEDVPEEDQPASFDKADAKSHESTNDEMCESDKKKPDGNDTSFIEKAPILLTTNMPLSHCFMEKPKYILQLKQKSRQIASLKFKISNLTKKIEELEDRCIVQERQLSYSFIKRLKTIRKNAAKGDPSATYILEQIRSYSNNSKMRWSDSTLTQCAIWCRKAPYAYEYFKKAEFFKLPCLGTVKRFMKKHPELKFQRKVNNSGPQDDDESSSDFDFDESDGQNEGNDFSEEGNDEPVGCETILSVPGDTSNPAMTETVEVKEQINGSDRNETNKAAENIASQPSDLQTELSIQSTSICDNVEKVPEVSKDLEPNGIQLTVDGSNLELQEIILPSGEVVQCYSSNVSNSTDVGSQYFIIPNVGDQNSVADHEYSVVQTDSLPVILQNFENSQVHLQQDQLIFVANSSEQVECNETEVTSA